MLRLVMALSPGTRLGPYEILSPIGAGGMGEVYRARDPRMGREVAIKLSAEHFSDRFEREVRAVAALNHANICQVYDVGPNYLVLELIEGPTLSDRIKAGAVPIEEALAIAHQIGGALEAAHEKGIIHRDLKPANIKLRPDGTVKVLDFGLAKIAEQPASSGNPEESPTIPMGATLAGQIMGTAAYMAPEQARGKPVDKRVDIWAFGVILHEMLSGRKLFGGETISDILAGVLTREPEWQRVPVKVQRLLESCLQKDPKHRLRDIADAWRLLEDAPAATQTSGLQWKIAAGVLAVISVIALWALWRRPLGPIEPAAIRLDFDLGPEASVAPSLGPSVILSPDGTRLVYVSQGSDGTLRLLTRRLDQPKAILLSGTDGANAPFFSPDGQWVGFIAQGKLKKVRLDGGEPIFVCDAPSIRGASWGEDGSIVAALDTQSGLSRVASEGGKPVAVTTLGFGETTHRWPQVLPGGRAVLFNISKSYGNYDEAAIAVVSLKDHRTKVLLEHAGMYPRYLPNGHLVYMTKGALFAAAFDLDRLEVRGNVKLLEQVLSNQNLGFAQLDVSRNGILAYRSGGTEGLATMQWLDGAGKNVVMDLEPASYYNPRLSPDGSRLLYQVLQGSNTDIWIYDWQRGSKTRLTSGGVNIFPAWSPDGRFVVFYSAGGIFWTRADRTGKPEPLIQSKQMQLPGSFFPDGSRLVYSERTGESGAEIRAVTIESVSGQLKAGQPQLLLKTSTVNNFASFSPDGRWLAYADAEAGKYEVYVRPFPDTGTQVPISNTGGVVPVWSRNGRELFYRTEDQRIMVTTYTVKGESFVTEKPRVWLGKPLANIGLGLNFDLAPDGKRLVAVMPAQNSEPRETQNHVSLMMNFFDEVRRRVAEQTK